MKVIVIGAGVIGLSIAENLSRRGIGVEVLERNPAAGQEASSAAAGILSPQGEAKGPGPFFELLKRGYSLIPETVARLESLTQIDVRYRAGGEIAVSFSPGDDRELLEEYLLQRQAGLQVEKLSEAEVRKCEPAVDGPLRWGLWWPQTAQIDCVRLMQAYVQLVRNQGVTVKTGTPVLRFLIEGDRVAGVATPSGNLESDWVVDCAGSWSGFDSTVGFAIPTVPVRGQMLLFSTRVPLLERIIRSPRAYLVQRSARQLMAGTTVERVGFDKAVTEEGRASIRRGAEEIAGGVRALSLESAWAGLRPGTPDDLPILGPAPFQGLLLATGHFRNGVVLGPLTGQLIADWIVKGSCSIDLTPFHVGRFFAHKDLLS